MARRPDPHPPARSRSGVLADTGCDRRCRMRASHPMNDSRAEWAREVVEAFGSITGADLYEDAAGDLICDIGHLCDEEGLDFVAMVRKAVAYWSIEQADPD